MDVITGKDMMRETVMKARESGLSVGLVPTMGFFHEGHLELMMRAAAENDVVVVSLFVNPTQFVEGEDFEDYPRDLERDLEMAAGAGVDYVFHPPVSEMYPPGVRTSVTVEELSDVMCGSFRPGHFTGVATVVAKLFNIVPAHRAYFGRKDAQQLAVIRRMATDLDFEVEVVGVPTVREEDGLAMSSRNTYLDAEQRAAATAISRALNAASAMIDEGERDAETVKAAVRRVVDAEPLARLEYVEICDNIFLRPLRVLQGEVLIALAARVGRARLIDNMTFEI